MQKMFFSEINNALEETVKRKSIRSKVLFNEIFSPSQFQNPLLLLS